MIKVRATAVLVQYGRILLVQQRVSSTRDWSLPGGGLKFGETLEACVIREVREETGIEVAVRKLLYVCDRIESDEHVVHVTFAVRQVGGRLRVGAEPEPTARPIRGVQMVPIDALCEYGFSERFRDLAAAGFPRSPSYQGLIVNIGL